MPESHFLLAALFATAASITPSPQLKSITFVPRWLPQAQFAGYFTAKDIGIYEKHGLDVKILAESPDVSAPSLLEKGAILRPWGFPMLSD